MKADTIGTLCEARFTEVCHRKREASLAPKNDPATNEKRAFGTAFGIRKELHI